MYNTKICRVCLSIDRRMCAVTDTVLQEMWEKLTNTNFNTIDGKPLLVCYICCAQLTRSHQLMRRALKAEELLTTFISNGLEQSKELISLMASQLNEFEYNCSIEHQPGVEIIQYEINKEEEIKEEKEQDIEIYIKEEVEGTSDSNHEMNADSDSVSEKDSDSDLPLRHMSLKNLLERKVELNFPKTATGEPATNQITTPDTNLDVSADVSNVLNTKDTVKINVNSENKDSKKVICVEDLMKSVEVLDSSSVHTIKRKQYTRRKRVPEEKYKCSTCQYVGAHKSDLNSHMRKHTGEKPYLCEFCDYKSAVKNTLKTHIRRVHKKEKNFSCNICEYVGFQNVDLKNHMFIHSEEKPYLCELCNYRSAVKRRLNLHMKYKHETEMNFLCHICQYKCVTISSLNMHLRKHTDEKPYKCDLCDYKAGYKSNLRNHILYKHTKERKFTCLVCGWKCVRKHDLNLHLRKHTGEKPFVCDYCGHNIASKSNLLKHIKYKHSNES